MNGNGIIMYESDSLAHYGVLGMKWGVRKQRPTRSPEEKAARRRKWAKRAAAAAGVAAAGAGAYYLYKHGRRYPSIPNRATGYLPGATNSQIRRSRMKAAGNRVKSAAQNRYNHFKGKHYKGRPGGAANYYLPGATNSQIRRENAVSRARKAKNAVVNQGRKAKNAVSSRYNRFKGKRYKAKPYAPGQMIGGPSISNNRVKFNERYAKAKAGFDRQAERVKQPIRNEMDYLKMKRKGRARTAHRRPGGRYK